MVKEKGFPSRGARARKKMETRRDKPKGIPIRDPEKMARDLLEFIHMPYISKYLEDSTPVFMDKIYDDKLGIIIDYKPNKKFITLVKGRIISKDKVDVGALKEIMHELGKIAIEHDSDIDWDHPSVGSPKKQYEDFCNDLNNPEIDARIEQLILKHKA